MHLDRIQMDILHMLLVILNVPNPMIRESALPNLGVRSEFLLRRNENPPFTNCTVRSSEIEGETSK